MRRALCVAAAAAVLAACGPPASAPSPISGVSSEHVVGNATYTGYDSGGIIAYHCIANVNADIALTDDRGVEYGTVTRATATSSMNLYGGAPCFPFLWKVKVWMECVPDCGGPQGLWTGADPQRVTMPFKREPSLAQIILHVEATYNGTPAQGDKQVASSIIHCGANPTTGVRTCLFPT